MKYLILSIALIFATTAQMPAPKPSSKPNPTSTATPTPVTSFAFKQGDTTYTCEMVTQAMRQLNPGLSLIKWICY